MNGRPDFDWAPAAPAHHWWFGIIPMILVAALIGVIIWAVIRLTRERPSGAAFAGAVPGGALPVREDQALAEARLRYARGEIDRDTYGRMASDLGGAPLAAPIATMPAAEPGGSENPGAPEA